MPLNGRRYTLWLLGLVMVLGMGCARRGTAVVYAKARTVAERVLADAEAVVLEPKAEAAISVLKNAARVDIAYAARRDGRPVAGRLVVWLKRIRLRWEVDRWKELAT